MARREDDAASKLAQGAFEARDTFSKQASENSRKLDFLGFGLLALFGGLKKSTFEFPIHLPDQLVVAGVLLTLALLADLLQYVYGTLAFAWFGRHLEEKAATSGWTAPDGYPPKINWITNVFFWGKIALTAAAWVLLSVHLFENLARD
jgi:hypothetical protein